MGVIKQQELPGDARACWVTFYQTVLYEIGFSGHKRKHIFLILAYFCNHPGEYSFYYKAQFTSVIQEMVHL
jgi:hypothetical protein